MLIRVNEKEIDFDDIRYIIIRNKFREEQSLSSIILQKNYINAKILFQNNICSLDLFVCF